jgi:hypothetical protein
MLMFRWRKLSVLFARLHIFAMWTFHLKSDASDVDTVHLQEDLDKLANWEQAWMISFHPEKCNVLITVRIEEEKHH